MNINHWLKPQYTQSGCLHVLTGAERKGGMIQRDQLIL
jgi:hypothetical protein